MRNENTWFYLLKISVLSIKVIQFYTYDGIIDLKLKKFEKEPLVSFISSKIAFSLPISKNVEHRRILYKPKRTVRSFASNMINIIIIIHRTAQQRNAISHIAELYLHFSSHTRMQSFRSMAIRYIAYYIFWGIFHPNYIFGSEFRVDFPKDVFRFWGNYSIYTILDASPLTYLHKQSICIEIDEPQRLCTTSAPCGFTLLPNVSTQRRLFNSTCSKSNISRSTVGLILRSDDV